MHMIYLDIHKNEYMQAIISKAVLYYANFLTLSKVTESILY